MSTRPDDLAALGAAVMQELIGESRGGRQRDPALGPLVDLAQVTVFGAVWSRPGLDDKTRTLICVVSDMATGRYPELASHARMALGQGWTRDELVEVALHLSGYVGAPLAREGLMTLRDVFAEESARDPRPSQGQQ